MANNVNNVSIISLDIHFFNHIQYRANMIKNLNKSL